MGKVRQTYSLEFKLRAIELYNKEHMGSKLIAKELGIAYSIIDRWIAHYKREGFEGLYEKRGKATGMGKERPGKLQTIEEKLVHLEAENAYLKKLLAARKAMK